MSFAVVTTRPSKIVCVGRNYADHAKELGNAVPESPILFIKPASSLQTFEHGIDLPEGLGECHYECELCIQIGSPLKNASVEQSKQAISGITLGLDLTLRDLQNTLKTKGHPWERAKAFDGSCLLGDWLSKESVADLTQICFSLQINGEIRQTGQTSHMLFDVVGLISHISHVFSLEVGDVIMTGTPAGVAKLASNDQLSLQLETILGTKIWQTHVN